jgi:hypothetical protein
MRLRCFGGVYKGDDRECVVKYFGAKDIPEIENPVLFNNQPRECEVSE